MGEQGRVGCASWQAQGPALAQAHAVGTPASSCMPCHTTRQDMQGPFRPGLPLQLTAFCQVNIVLSTPHTAMFMLPRPIHQMMGSPAMKKQRRQIWEPGRER